MNTTNKTLRWALTAPNEEVGPACSNVPVPETIAMDEVFREPYVQGYRHALNDVRQMMKDHDHDQLGEYRPDARPMKWKDL